MHELLNAKESRQDLLNNENKIKRRMKEKRLPVENNITQNDENHYCLLPVAEAWQTIDDEYAE